jgi:hypothetical protein
MKYNLQDQENAVTIWYPIECTVPYIDDTDQPLHLHCFYPIFFLYEVTPVRQLLLRREK